MNTNLQLQHYPEEPDHPLALGDIGQPLSKRIRIAQCRAQVCQLRCARLSPTHLHMQLCRPEEMEHPLMQRRKESVSRSVSQPAICVHARVSKRHLVSRTRTAAPSTRRNVRASTKKHRGITRIFAEQTTSPQSSIEALY